MGTIDRIVYPNYESLIALAAAAAVTERIRLVTDILISPLRTNTALLAKQAATIDNLSQGRLVLGLAVGGRQDDYEVSGADFGSRGKAFDRQLEELGALWRGERGVGPPSARGDRPTVLIGGGVGRRVPPRRPARRRLDARRRHARRVRRGPREAAGRLGGGGSRGRAAHDGPLLLRARRRCRAGRHARASGTTTGSSGEYADQIVASAAKDEETVKAYLSGFEAAGVDEVICFPTSTDPDQVDLLAAAVH